MIIFIELSSRADRHAPFNAMLLRTISLARPSEQISFWADPGHIDAVRSMLPDASQITFHSIRLCSQLPDKIELSSYRRIWHALRTLLGIYSRYAIYHPTMVIASGSPAGILAAYMVHRFRRAFIQIIAHGELTTLQNGWRPRNPFYRFLLHEPVLRLCHGRKFRYVVLEESIKERLQQLLPSLAGAIDVFPHPVNEQEIANLDQPVGHGPIRIGSL